MQTGPLVMLNHQLRWHMYNCFCNILGNIIRESYVKSIIICGKYFFSIAVLTVLKQFQISQVKHGSYIAIFFSKHRNDLITEIDVKDELDFMWFESWRDFGPITTNPTMLLSHIPQYDIQNRNAHFCSEWCSVGFGTAALWDLWDLSINWNESWILFLFSWYHRVSWEVGVIFTISSSTV